MNTNVYNPSFCSAPSEQLQQLKSKADSTNIRITHSLKGLCHSQSVIHAQGYQQVLGNVESIRWRIAQNVSDKTNLHKTVKAKKAGKHSMGKNYSLYPDAILSSTLSSFLFICLLQCNPIPLLFAVLLSTQATSWHAWVPDIHNSGNTRASLCSSSDASFSKLGCNQGLTSESHLTTAVNCYSVQMFLGRREF